MPDNPTVCCILLTKDRPEMAARAVKCFREQAYENKRLLVMDSGDSVYGHIGSDDAIYYYAPGHSHKTIGESRNIANSCIVDDIIAHWDDDDWSHPNRLAEQVALLQSSGADLVGYNECLFWDTRHPAIDRQFQAGAEKKNPVTGLYPPTICGEAWLYRYPNPAYCLGSSFMYWRKAWQRQPFDDVNHGEDERFRLKVKSVGISAVSDFVFLLDGQFAGVYDQLREYEDYEPRMICAIHGGNTSHYAPERDRAMWRRAENWDATCERMMKL